MFDLLSACCAAPASHMGDNLFHCEACDLLLGVSGLTTPCCSEEVFYEENSEPFKVFPEEVYKCMNPNCSSAWGATGNIMHMDSKWLYEEGIE